METPRIQVDFNELVQDDVVLLSKADEVEDSEGNMICLSEGLKISIYEFNHYEDGTKEYLLAEGIVIPNNININGEWSKAVKWCCQINENGIVVENS